MLVRSDLVRLQGAYMVTHCALRADAGGYLRSGWYPRLR
jgi:hypothetical protein